MRNGELVQTPQSIHDIRKMAIAETELFYHTHGDREYTVCLENRLYELKQELIRGLK
jgi:hypothetical protein